MKIKEIMRNKGMQVGTALMMAAPAISCAAFAANDGVSPVGEPGAADSTSVVSIITNAASGLKSDAVIRYWRGYCSWRCLLGCKGTSGRSTRAWQRNKSIISISPMRGAGQFPFPLIFSLLGGACMSYTFFSFSSIFTSALPVPAADRVGAVVLLHGSSGGRGGR